MRRGRWVALLAVAALCGLAWLLRTRVPRARDVALAPATQLEPVQPAVTLATELVESPVSVERSDVSAEVATDVPDAGPARPIRVRVTDRAGEPLAGARVRLLASPNEDGAYEERFTDASGRCELDRAPVAGWRMCYLDVEKDGCFHERAEFSMAEEIAVALDPSRRLFGRVLDGETRRGIPGAQVMMRHDDRCRWCQVEVIVAGPDGAYELPSVPLSEEGVSLSASADGYPTRGLRMRTAGETSPLQHDFELVRGLRLSVRVVDFDTRAPLEWAWVNAGSDSGRTDAEGRVELDVPSDQAITLDTGVSDPRDVYCAVRARFDAEEAALGSVEIPVPRHATLAGTMRDPEGRAIEGASVSAVPTTMRDEEFPAGGLGLPESWTLKLDDGMGYAESSADGSYRIVGLVPHAGEYHVWARAARFVDARPQLRGSGRPGEALSLDITLQPMGGVAEVRGRVTLNGEPAKASVTWQGPTQRSYVWTENGAYHLKDIEAGAGSLRVSFNTQERRLGSFPGSTVQLQLAAGEERVQDFALTLASISGHARFSDGRPAPGTRLRAWGGKESRAEVSVSSDADGSYRFDVPDQGSYSVTAWSGTGDYERRDGIVPGSSDVDFVLPETATLRYRVVDEQTGASVGTHLLCWRRVGETGWKSAGYTVPGAQGVHEIQLPLGGVELLACPSDAAYRPGFVRDLAIDASSPDRVETIGLARGLEVSFALDPAPFPADHALLLLPAGEWDGVRGQRGGDGWHWSAADPGVRYMVERRVLSVTGGRATLRGLGPGPHRFKAFPDDLAIEPAEIEVSPSAADPILVRWRAR